MNYKIRLQVLGMVLGALVHTSQAAVVLVDNFDEYSGDNSVINSTAVAESALQSNPGGSSGIGGAWSRFGVATSQGIFSIDSPSVSGRAAEYGVNWGGGNNGTIRYTFATVQNLSLLSAVNLDMALNTSTGFTGTMVTVQIANASTTWQLTTPLSLVTTDFATFTFDVSSAANMTRTGGSNDYATTLGSVSTIAFRFTNSVQNTGSQRIYFDNFNLATVPEPSTLAVLSLAGLLFMSRRFARRRNH